MKLPTRSIAAFAAAATLALALSPASAFTLAAPSRDAPAASAPIQKVWWDRWGNWRPNHRVPDPIPGYEGRRCWAGFNGVVHCRSEDESY